MGSSLAGAATDALTPALRGCPQVSSGLATGAGSCKSIGTALRLSLPFTSMMRGTGPLGRTILKTRMRNKTRKATRAAGDIAQISGGVPCSVYKMGGSGNPWENMLANLLRNSCLTAKSLENQAVTCLSFFRCVTLLTMIFQLGQSYSGNPGQSLTCCATTL